MTYTAKLPYTMLRFKDLKDQLNSFWRASQRVLMSLTKIRYVEIYNPSRWPSYGYVNYPTRMTMFDQTLRLNSETPWGELKIRRVVDYFSRISEEFGNVVNHCLECLIYFKIKEKTSMIIEIRYPYTRGTIFLFKLNNLYVAQFYP